MLNEAIPLCAATIVHVIAAAGVRALVIKGPAFAELGVRPLRPSSDVDVLIDPALQQEALDALRRNGWHEWAPAKLYEPFGAHSVTLEHDAWPCSLDVHWRFPGFLGPPPDVFELLWEGRTEVKVAHQSVATPSRPHALAIEVLHVLRDSTPEAEKAAVAAILRAMPRPLDPGEVRVLGELVGPTGSSRTLATLARLTGIQDAVNPEAEDHDAALRAWKTRQRSSAAPLSWWFIELRGHPLQALGRGVRHAWLSDGQARTWAKAKGVDYRNRWQVLCLRGKEGIQAVKVQVRGRRGA